MKNSSIILLFYFKKMEVHFKSKLNKTTSVHTQYITHTHHQIPHCRFDT